MTEARTYDLAIVGAGAAGLQLLYEYLQKAEHIDAKILLIDSGDRTKKSWCYWAKNGQESFPFLIEKSWSKITYRSSQSMSQTQEIDSLAYHYISSTHFFNYFFDQFIPAHTQITHEMGWVSELIESASTVEIKLQNGARYVAKQVADARIGHIQTAGKPSLSQHFWGKFVEFDSDVLNSDSVTMMDFSQPQGNNDYAVFHYILPFSSRKGLIETTVFSKQAYDEAAYELHWNQYMEANFPGKTYQVSDVERGTIPMKIIESPSQTGKIFSIGTAAGRVKASTGYAFTRMHQDAKNRVNQLATKRQSRFTFYDSILLNMIRTENRVIPLVMDRLFGRIGFARILDFLDEKTTIWQEIKLFSQLQIPLFIKHLVTKNR